jgi:CRP/FNR family transcriptional regulator
MIVTRVGNAAPLSNCRKFKAKMSIRSTVLNIGRPVNVRAGTKVFAQGKPAKSLFYLSSGAIVTCVSLAGGDEAMVVDVSSGNFVPVAALLSGPANYNVDGYALSDCELVAIEIVKLRKLLLEDALISNFFLEISLQRLQRILGQFVDAALLDATGRIAKWLLAVAEEQYASLADGIVIQLDVTTRVVGLATAGMARETVSRKLSWLVREGIIKQSKKSVTLVDISRLISLSDGSAFAV